MSGRGASGMLAALAGAVMGGLLGCHTIPGGIEPDIAPNPGRADATFASPLDRVFPAALDALDEIGINPASLSIRDGEGNELYGTSVVEVGKVQRGRNAALRARVGDALLRGEVGEPGGPSKRATQVELTYRGTAEGRTVAVILRSAKESSKATVRVGRPDDAAAARILLDRIAAHLAERVAGGG